MQLIHQVNEATQTEIIIDTETGKSYATARMCARICSKGLAKAIDHKQITRYGATLFQGGKIEAPFDAQIPTRGGLQGGTLYSEVALSKFIFKYNPDLYELMAQAGVRVFLHTQAGYKVTSSAVNQSEHKLPQSYLAALKELVAVTEAKEAAEAKLIEQAPKVEFAESIEVSDNVISFADFAKIIGTGRNRLFVKLRAEGIMPPNHNIPYQKYIDQGYFEVTEVVKGNQVFPTARITGKGQIYLAKKIK
jgi:phage antirepressor YoqD-like protein